ncbi:regulatory protein RecX [Salinibacterium sp. UTAS2018]|uniref:regulatory protein RecX n=1 Tax=Salinibacterium sp. UTAS2018 TaxID=2508880 RepID=UPI0010098037|nr:regulatory protein RecX [Salinibacterium sp. UTAS2018]QAV68996.1 regulatory protein RecX [Salinibacterium sp. UTAS2018]
MTNSDDDYIAPVINLFGDRAPAAQPDAAAMEPSSENVGGTSTSSAHVVTEDDGWAKEAPVEPSPYDARDLDAVPAASLAPVASISPVRALPTMRDFEPARSRAHDDVDSAARESGTELAAEGSESSVSQGTGSSRSARREARDGFSEISRVSMRALARRGMSSQEMTQFLGTREFESDEIDAEIERLEGSALLDDAALAETLTRTLRERKGLGASAITAELRRRKIDQEHIDVVVDFERDDEQERANELAFKRAPQLRSLDSVTAKRRLSGFLMRRGYSGSIVSAAVNAALASGGSSNGPTFR